MGRYRILLAALVLFVHPARAAEATLRDQKNRTLALLILTIMVWQTKEKLPLVRHAVLAFLRVMSKLPPEELA